MTHLTPKTRGQEHFPPPNHHSSVGSPLRVDPDRIRTLTEPCAVTVKRSPEINKTGKLDLALYFNPKSRPLLHPPQPRLTAPPNCRKKKLSATRDKDLTYVGKGLTEFTNSDEASYLRENYTDVDRLDRMLLGSFLKREIWPNEAFKYDERTTRPRFHHPNSANEIVKVYKGPKAGNPSLPKLTDVNGVVHHQIETVRPSPLENLHRRASIDLTHRDLVRNPSQTRSYPPPPPGTQADDSGTDKATASRKQKPTIAELWKPLPLGNKAGGNGALKASTSRNRRTTKNYKQH
ncbi:hypothetical protein YC2023_022561 [Brassica napus]